MSVIESTFSTGSLSAINWHKDKKRHQENKTFKEIMKIKHFKTILLILISCTLRVFGDDNNGIIVKDVNILDTIRDKINKSKHLQRDSLVDYTVNQVSTCKVHHCEMFKDTVPNVICGDMNIDEILLGKPNLHPHGCKFVCASALITRGIIYMCSQCIKIYESENK